MLEQGAVPVRGLTNLLKLDGKAVERSSERKLLRTLNFANDAGSLTAMLSFTSGANTMDASNTQAYFEAVYVGLDGMTVVTVLQGDHATVQGGLNQLPQSLAEPALRWLKEQLR